MYDGSLCLVGDADIIARPATTMQPQGAACKPYLAVSSRQVAAGTPKHQVRSTSGSDDEAIQVLEDRLRDWLMNNSPPPPCITWSKPSSADGAPPIIAKLRRTVKVYVFSMHY